jgi:ABC-type Fe3+ transport system substrate-binding protein
MIPFARPLLAAFVFMAMLTNSAYAGGFQFDELWKRTKDEFSSRLYKATGTLRVCAANELKPWLEKDVVPAFKENEKSVTIRESDLVFNGSGVLVDNWNQGNRDRCDIIILGSDVAALRSGNYDKNKATYLAYSPIVVVGQKEKLDAAKAYLDKKPGDALSCADLATVASKGRLGRILKSGQTTKLPVTSRLTIEMSTSNSGQSAFITCVYSTFDATTAKEVDEALATTKSEPGEKSLKDFMNTVKFDVESSSRVKDEFVQSPLGVGGEHLAIFTYESYLPEIKKAAAQNGIELEIMYPAIGILSNFPATIVAKEGTPANETANAFLKLAKSKSMQESLLKYGLRPAIAGIAMPDYMPLNIGVGDSPRNRGDLKKFWDIVGSVPSVKDAKMDAF